MVCSKPAPFLHEAQEKSGTPRVSIVTRLNTGVARNGQLPGCMERPEAPRCPQRWLRGHNWRLNVGNSVESLLGWS